jgi:hypothetical protein
MLVYCEKERDYVFIQFFIPYNSVRIYLTHSLSSYLFGRTKSSVLKVALIIKKNPKFLELNKERIKLYVASR